MANSPYTHTIAGSLTAEKLNTRTETQIEELKEIFGDINGVISQLISILEPITVPFPTEGSVGPVAIKPTTTVIYDKLADLKDRGFETLDRLHNLRKSIDL